MSHCSTVAAIIQIIYYSLHANCIINRIVVVKARGGRNKIQLAFNWVKYNIELSDI